MSQACHRHRGGFVDGPDPRETCPDCRAHADRDRLQATLERVREYEETPLPPEEEAREFRALGLDGLADAAEERARKELMDLRQRFQAWSRQQHGSLDGCLHSIAVESELPDGVTLPMVAEAALHEIVALRAALERVRGLPEQWRTDPQRRRCLSPTEEVQLGLCADELKQALESKP